MICVKYQDVTFGVDNITRKSQVFDPGLGRIAIE